MVFELPQALETEVGALGTLTFPAAWYAYAGSAMGGLSRRVLRYLGPVSNPRWHVDYLLPHACNLTLVLAESNRRVECLAAAGLAERLPSVRRFGASDCRCDSHLFMASAPHEAVEAASLGLRRAGAVPVVLAGFGEGGGDAASTG